MQIKIIVAGPATHLVTRSLLQQHVAALVEQEHAEGAMQPNTVMAHFVAVAFARVANVLVCTVDENAVFCVEEELLLLRLDGLGEIVCGACETSGGGREQLLKTIDYRHDDVSLHSQA